MGRVGETERRQRSAPADDAAPRRWRIADGVVVHKRVAGKRRERRARRGRAMNKPFTPPLREAPHNIEAEQALLGAILVNNEAFYRVSDFLEPRHFFEPIHQRIFELAGELVRANKVATPVTLKTFLPGDLDVAGLTLNQYLARLAAEATTIINAEDYGRAVYDLSIRRDLIAIGEDMVNLAYDAPVDATPLSQIDDVERQLYKLAESGRYDTGFQGFGQALAAAVDMAGYACATVNCRIRDRLGRPRCPHGRPATVRSYYSGRSPRHG